MTEQVKAAVIGFWRMGASEEQIIHCTDLQFFEIRIIIQEYQNKLKNDKTKEKR